MLSEERQSRILSRVIQNGSTTVQELMELLGASESTIRRDLADLDSKGLLVKVFGGAVSKESTFYAKDVFFDSRKEHNHDEKMVVAKYAASLIQNDDFVFLDAGTTTDLMIDYITAKQAVFVTNGFSHAQKLAAAGFTAFILGGEVKAATESIVGEEALESLNKYHFTKGFWGTNGISVSAGFSTPDVKEALIKQAAIRRTSDKYILCDATKFSQLSCVSFAAFTDAMIITTALPEGSSYKQYKHIIEV
ncbi:MAG: DeoR/GlpR family DNA-binding transcription regulator [Treponema sp.]|nr:DeoR/GlpR family DNA-binding transcription regulator [Treponema sp.]